MTVRECVNERARVFQCTAPYDGTVRAWVTVISEAAIVVRTHGNSLGTVKLSGPVFHEDGDVVLTVFVCADE